MSHRISFRVDRDLPETISPSPFCKTNVTIDIFDTELLETAFSAIESIGAVIVSAISISLPENLMACWEDPDNDWVAGVVGSDNHEWVAPENYRMPYDLSAQRVAPRLPLRIFTGPRGMFSKIGLQFAARASFRKFVDEMPESFNYTTGDVVRRGKVLETWSRVEPIEEREILSKYSLSNMTYAKTIHKNRLLWAGSRIDDDFGFVHDPLLHGNLEQESCALVPVNTARKLSKKFPGDFVALPVYDRQSTVARRSIEVYQMISERLPIEGWNYPNRSAES